MIDFETLPNGHLQKPTLPLLIKRLFCNHEYEQRFYTDRYTKFKCIKCGKEIWI